MEYPVEYIVEAGNLDQWFSEGLPIILATQRAILEREDGTLSEFVATKGQFPSLSPEERIYILNGLTRNLLFKVTFEGDDFLIEFRCELEDPFEVVAAKATDAAALIVKYFQRMKNASSVFAGGPPTQSPLENAQMLSSEIDADLPRIPGLRVQLLGVDPFDTSAHLRSRVEIILVPHTTVTPPNADIPYDSYRASIADEPQVLHSNFDFFNAAIWTSSDDGSDVRNALEELVSEYGYFEISRGPEQRGSWWQKILFRSKNTVDSRAFRQRLREAERRLQLELVEKTAAEVGNIKADSAAKLLAQVSSHNQAVVVFDQIVIVKDGDKLIIKSVDAVTAGNIEKSTVLLSDPDAVLRLLTGTESENQEVPKARKLELGD